MKIIKKVVHETIVDFGQQRKSKTTSEELETIDIEKILELFNKESCSLDNNNINT